MHSVRGFRIVSGGVLVALALGVEAATYTEPAAPGPTSAISGAFVPARPVSMVNPEYPRRAMEEGREGWVRMHTCVDEQGAVVDPTVEASTDPQFEIYALNALRQWRYAPALVAGVPTRQCIELTIRFSLSEGRTRPRKSFARDVAAIDALIRSGGLDAAEEKLDAIDARNRYEQARTLLVRADLARARGDGKRELRDLNDLVGLADELEPALMEGVLVRAFSKNLEQGQLAAALYDFSALQRAGAQRLSDSQGEAGAELQARVLSGDELRTPGVLERRDSSEMGRAFWSARPLRHAFGFDAPSGHLDRFELRCKEGWYAALVVSGKVWRFSPSWRNCLLVVVGDEGATFTLVEHPDEQPTGD